MTIVIPPYTMPTRANTIASITHRDSNTHLHILEELRANLVHVIESTNDGFMKNDAFFKSQIDSLISTVNGVANEWMETTIENNDAITAGIISDASSDTMSELAKSGVFGIVAVPLSPTNGAANRNAIAAAIAANPGRVIQLPAGDSPVDDSIPVKVGVTIRGEGYATNLVFNKNDRPLFDVLDATSPPTIERMRITGDAPRAQLSGASVRGGAPKTMYAGIWTNTDGTKVRDVIGHGFMSIVLAINWKTATNARVGYIADVEVSKLTVSGCDWGFLGAGLRRVTLDGVRGSYNLFPGSPDPAHLIYISEPAVVADWNEDITILNAEAWDGSPSFQGHAVQLKKCDGVKIDTISARRCNGLMSFINVRRAKITDIRSIADTNATQNSLYLQAGNEDIEIDGVYISGTKNPVRWQSIRGRLSNVVVELSSAANSDISAVAVYGADTTVENIRVNETGTGSQVVVSVGEGAHTIRGIKSNSARHGVLDSIVGNSIIEIEPSQITTIVGGLTVVRGANTQVRFGETVAAYDQSATSVRADKVTTAVISITSNATFLVAATTQQFKGARIRYELRNTTAAASGLIGWSSLFAFGAGGPIAGVEANKVRSVTFIFDGTLWVEVARG